MPAPIAVTFIGGLEGAWRIERIDPVIGETLPPAARLAVHEGSQLPQGAAGWTLRGVAGHARYVRRNEQDALVAVQPPLGRPQATRAALIPIRKSAAWWDLAQDERRAILEEQSHHIAQGLKYLPAIARRLYQSRELGGPFDFLTWFEYAPEHAEAFEELTRQLRSTEEWKYIDREIDVRLVR
jgi:chlorite dismutase